MQLPGILRLHVVLLLTLPMIVGPGCADAGGGNADVEDYIRSDVYSALVFEVDRVPEVDPNAASLDSLAATADAVLDKPDGVSVVMDDVLASAGAAPVWTTSALRDLSDATRDLPVDATTMRMQVLYVNGQWSESETVIGLQIRRDVVVIFAEQIEAACQSVFPLIQPQLCRGLETSVLTHEFGHAIGLVDNGLAMVTPHEDADHPAHDPKSDCLMYWAAEGHDVAGLLGDRITGGGSEALPFCSDCLADIAAVRDL